MLHCDLIGFGLFLGYFVVAGLPPILLKVYLDTPFEITRKMYHLVITGAIWPLSTLFSTWYVAVLAAIAFLAVVYPILLWMENSAFYKRIAVERQEGEFKKSFVIVQLSIVTLLSVFWGLLGIDWRYVAVAAVMAWGFGDAAAALVGKAFGRHKILHPWTGGKKTIEGTLAMYIVAGLAILFTLLVYAGQPWYVSLAVAAAVAPVCSAVELFTPRGMDTLTVPLAAAFAILPLMILFSRLGV